MSETVPMPSQRGHMPPVRLKLALTILRFPRSTLIPPLARTVGTLKAKACGEPMCGLPSRLNRMRSIALASVAVPTVERGLAPIRSWSTRIAVVSPSSTSTSGRAMVGMKPCTEGAVGLVDEPLRLRRDRAEHERALARARHAGEHGQASLGELDAHVMEVVHARAHDPDEVVAVRRMGTAARARRRRLLRRHPADRATPAEAEG